MWQPSKLRPPTCMHPTACCSAPGLTADKASGGLPAAAAGAGPQVLDWAAGPARSRGLRPCARRVRDRHRRGRRRAGAGPAGPERAAAHRAFDPEGTSSTSLSPRDVSTLVHASPVLCAPDPTGGGLRESCGCAGPRDRRGADGDYGGSSGSPGSRELTEWSVAVPERGPGPSSVSLTAGPAPAACARRPASPRRGLGQRVALHRAADRLGVARPRWGAALTE